MQEARFDFYEKVHIKSHRREFSQVNGKLAAVLGRSQDDDGVWNYAVHVYEDDVCWSCDESDLESTGEFDRRDTFYDGSSIRVRPGGDLSE